MNKHPAMGLTLNGGGALILLPLLLSLLTPHGECSDSTTAALSALQSESPSGVIRLNNTLRRSILSLRTPRPFHFLIFFDAQKLHYKSELALPTLKSEFSLVSSSFLTNNPNKKSLLFFFHVEFEESQDTFGIFGVNALPHIRLIPSTAADVKTDSIKLDPAHFSTLADSMAEFIQSETTISVGPINRPPLLTKTQIVIAIGFSIIWAPYLVKKLLSGKTTLHGKTIWMAGSVFVYFFSVSGTMFNIIRRTPMFIADRRDGEKIVFFYKGSGVQLGAEGFSVGFLYTIVGLLLAFVCHVLVRVRDRKWQRISMALVMLVAFWAVKKVVSLLNWKTGYRIHGYLPSTRR